PRTDCRVSLGTTDRSVPPFGWRFIPGATEDRRGQPPMWWLARSGGRSVAGLVDHAARGDPGHHAAQLLADGLDLVRVVVAAGRLEGGLADSAFLHPVADETAGLDVLQHRLHPGLGLLAREDARAGDVLAVLGRVGDRVVHVGDAALVDEVDDQLH